MALPNVQVRWGHRVTDLASRPNGATLRVEAVDGAYELQTEWLIACDGARSTVREVMGLDFEGRVFEDNFLIADIRMTDHDMPPERWLS